MRNTKKDKRIKFAVGDYYGTGKPDHISIEKISLHLTGRKLMVLNDELKSDIFAIKENMKDSLYMNYE